MKPVRLSAHALSYTKKRGFTASEVEEAVRSSPWIPAEMGRLECHGDLPFGREWNGTIYKTKRVRPIFVQEADEILIVTVYTYYF